MVITSKIIKVKSAGRFTRSTGIAIIGPQQSFYKEKVSEIGYLLKKYPNIKIAEKIEDGRLVNLTLVNYDKNNNVKSEPVSVETPDKQEETPQYNNNTNNQQYGGKKNKNKNNKNGQQANKSTEVVPEEPTM